MDYEKIIGHGLRHARKKVASPEYAQDLMVGIFESEEVMDNIKSKLLKHLFYSSLRILRSIAPACPYAGTPRYQYALVSALKEIGAKENLVTIPYTHFSKEILVLGNDWLNIYNLSNVIAIGLEDQMIDVKADPMVVAKLISRWQNTEIPPSMLTDILNESFALNKIEEILLPTARLLLQAILKDSGVNADIFLFGNLNYEISDHQQNGVQLSTHNKKYSLKLCAEPNIVAKLLAMIHEYPIDNAFYEEIFRESCALYRIQEIMESSVHKLVDDLLGEDFYSFRLELCGTERFKVMLFKGVYLMDVIYTDLQHVREDVHNVITSYSNNPTHDEILDPSWYVM